MDKIYAELIINGMKNFSQVPITLQEKVKIILSKYIDDGVITELQLEILLKQ